MEGATLKFERGYDLAVAQVWHGARFNALAQVGKLRGLKSYLSKATSTAKSAAAQALGFFHALRARGIPIKIERVERKPRAEKPAE